MLHEMHKTNADQYQQWTRAQHFEITNEYSLICVNICGFCPKCCMPIEVAHWGLNIQLFTADGWQLTSLKINLINDDFCCIFVRFTGFLTFPYAPVGN